MPIEIAGITDADLDTALANIGVLPQREQQQLLAELDELEKTQAVEKRQETFLEFIDHVYPGYKVGNHHRRLAKIFEAIANGEKKRVIVNIAPRHGKSELIFWVSTRTRRLLWHLIQLTLQLTLEDVFVILWVVMLIKMFFLT
jgi:hypothetical protein